ncbi:sulfite exporter TauE/SafE family protein [Pseudoflavitalea sp. G-6-1-2]|uniref:sulfite exporter TauE/SafE family protein n=1 Tax=Pseudoflavitalea sp. G-6-1-2 TaxID=2728841 RepID=UPI00146D11EA|nr:sulfite exporter TauE/SafE family protein [Pseudoflavitalea sp. G-6-1-2]NML21099.1 sulfite exporter TauE/SafE family protein [Pseudoflavitalea sp. G-6-1-2]
MASQEMIILVMIGLAAGILSGLIGVGGGVIMVPALAFFMHYSQHQAQGTSLGVLTLPVAALAFFKYYTECRKMGTPLDPKVILILAAGFIVGGFVGSSLAVKINQEMLKKIFGIIMLYTAFKLFGWDTIIIRWVRSVFQ